MTHSLIHNATLIDVVSGCVLKDAAVLMKDDRISQAGARESIKLPDDEVRMIDAKGGFLLPGFIDCHVHLVLEDLTIPKLMSTPLSLTLFKTIDHMRRTLAAGVTSVRDGGGVDLGLKQAVESGLVEGPRMQISITILTMTGGHLDYAMQSGNEYSLFPPYPGRPDGKCDGVEEVRRKVREVLRAGAEVIKVCTTGGTMSPHDHPTHAQFSVEELKVMVQEADYHGSRKVMAHAQGSRGIKNAIRAGVHSIEHGMYLDDEAIELMLERNTYLVPTLLAPVYTLNHCAEMPDLPEWGIRKMKETLEINLESISKAHKAGVKIAMGTDACVSPHGTNLQELGLLCRIGMTPLEALRSATVVAAECLGWQDQVGTLEAGKLADMVVVREDPLKNIASLADKNNIAMVVKGGRVVK
ncbi:MAG: amidohydrolase family protein [Acidobacteriota bacterium]